MEAFEKRITENQQFSQQQLSSIQENLNNNDSYSFRKKGNEEQHKVNGKALQRMKEADGFLRDALASGSADDLSAAQRKVAEGIDILEHRQKLIKLADSSDSGWRVVREYEAHPLADDSEDEKKIHRAQVAADRKLRQERRTRSQRYSPYPSVTAGQSSVATSGASASSAGSSLPSTRRLGLCFRCGRPGHWRKECRAVLPENGSAMAGKDNKISTSNALLFESLPGSSYTHSSSVVTPVGKLESCYKHWESAGAGEYILDVVKRGYKLPFRNIPDRVVLQNNRSARENPVFVDAEILSLLEKGCISEVTEIPHVVNPLTVAYGRAGKPRLVLDCRHLNVDLFKYTCCFEDQSVAKTMFSKGDYMISFDIKGAYHHIMIFPEHRTFLGFSWEFNGQKRYFVYNVLAFGLSTAGFIFTKLLRVLVAKWRSMAIRIVVFLDDGLCGAGTYENALQTSKFIHDDLSRFGFLIAEEKCLWTPCQCISWLGYTWNSGDGTFYVSEERIVRFENAVKGILRQILQGVTCFSARTIAQVVGMIISMQSAVGYLVRLRTRSLYQCVINRAGWDSPVMVTSRAFDELLYLEKHLRASNTGKLKDSTQNSVTSENEEAVVFCDASGAGFGDSDGNDVIGCWSETECGLSSTWRELEAVYRVLHSSVKTIEGHDVVVNTDNKNVCSILKTGSRKCYLHEIAVRVDDLCSENEVNLKCQWVPRGNNVQADFLSRCTDSDDWSVEPFVFYELERMWGPHTCDRFACSYNAKCEMFYSKYWCPGTSGVDAFNFPWLGENNWLVPPPRLIPYCISKVKNEKCKATLVVPKWKSAPFWPLLFDKHGKQLEFVANIFEFPPGHLTVRGRGKNGIFDGRPLGFSLMALRFE